MNNNESTFDSHFNRKYDKVHVIKLTRHQSSSSQNKRKVQSHNISTDDIISSHQLSTTQSIRSFQLFSPKRINIDGLTNYSAQQNKKRRKPCGIYPLWWICACLCCSILAILIATILIFTRNSTSTSTTTAGTTITTTTSTTTVSTSTSTSTTTTATTITTTSTTTVSTSTTSMTTTTTTAYCANSCSGTYNPTLNASTCSLYCDDGGSYYCRNSSTYCAGKYYSPTGFSFCDPTSVRFTAVCNTITHCCVYDNYFPDYYCLSKASCGFTG